MQQVIDEVQAIAINADVKVSHREPSTMHLLQRLFGMDPARYHTVPGESFTLLFPTTEFVVICDDLMVNLEPDFIRPIPDPRGIWTDHVREWIAHYDQYTPCDPFHKLGGLTKENAGFSIYQRTSKAA